MQPPARGLLGSDALWGAAVGGKGVPLMLLSAGVALRNPSEKIGHLFLHQNLAGLLRTRALAFKKCFKYELTFPV